VALNIFSVQSKARGNYSAGGAGGLRPLAGVRGVPEKFPFFRGPPQAAREGYLNSYGEGSIRYWWCPRCPVLHKKKKRNIFVP
jgi:hypothetical protein